MDPRWAKPSPSRVMALFMITGDTLSGEIGSAIRRRKVFVPRSKEASNGIDRNGAEKNGVIISYRNFLYSYEQLIVIARSEATKQSYRKWLGIRLHILRNEIATPFGLAMTVVVSMLH